MRRLLKCKNVARSTSLLASDASGQFGNIKEIAADEADERVAEARSVCPFMFRATRELQWSVQWDATSKDDANPQNRSQLGSRTVSVLVNVECIVRTLHYGVLNTPLELVHTARRLRRVGY